MYRVKVLIVEDEPLIALSMRQALSLAGFEVTGIAATGGDAVYLAEKTRPDLAVCDVHLPGQRDGIECAALLRAKFGIYVVFVTANDDAITRERIARESPAGFVQKPFSYRHLVDAIEGAVALARNASQTPNNCGSEAEVVLGTSEAELSPLLENPI